jgi:hypothetical protein
MTNKVENIIFSLLLILYIFFGYNTPIFIIQLINSGVGIILLILFCVYMYTYTNIFLSVLSTIASIVLIYRSFSMGLPIFSQFNKDLQMAVFNNELNKYTLEQEIVKKMVPNSNFQRYYNSFGYVFNPNEDESVAQYATV